MTTDLIRYLERDHDRLLTTLDEISDTGIGTAEGKQKLREAKKLMINHMEKEDAELYPALEERAEDDPEVEHTLNRFLDGMDEISDDAMDFFETYTGDDAAGMQFAKDAGRLLATLKMRMRKEENRLFPLYED